MLPCSIFKDCCLSVVYFPLSDVKIFYYCSYCTEMQVYWYRLLVAKLWRSQKFHFVKAVIMKSAADLSYRSLFSRPEDKMSHFLTRLLVCYVSVSLCHWDLGGDKERCSCWNANKKYTGWYSSLVLFYSGYQCTKKKKLVRGEERERETVEGKGEGENLCRQGEFHTTRERESVPYFLYKILKKCF